MSNPTHIRIVPIVAMGLLISITLIVGAMTPVIRTAIPRIRSAAAYRDVWCAAITNRPDDLLAALKASGSPNARNPADEPALMVAAHNGNTECVRYGGTPLSIAIKEGYPKIADMLRRQGAQP